ncbi:MAG: NUDIX hydrolase, partial [Deltaproteobacteria bacterium]
DRLFRRLILETYDWVNIVARTPEGRFVVVRQYRFGTGHVTSEIPGGMVEPGEDHREAAIRELREESGFTSDQWTYLGAVEPNPAIMNNRCHQWFADQAVRTEPLAQDDGEDIVVETLSLEEIRQEIREGRFCHSLALLALTHVVDLWGRAGGRCQEG